MFFCFFIAYTPTVFFEDDPTVCSRLLEKVLKTMIYDLKTLLSQYNTTVIFFILLTLFFCVVVVVGFFLFHPADIIEGEHLLSLTLIQAASVFLLVVRPLSSPLSALSHINL